MKKIVAAIARRIDMESLQKGWWMLLLIMGTIAILFVICWVLVSRHGS